MRQHNIIAIDLAKRVFQLCCMTPEHKVVFNRQLSRRQLAEFIAQQPVSTIVMEACYSSHHWGRCFLSMGHEVQT